MSEDLNESRWRLHAVTGELNYHLELFGDKLAKQMKYQDVDGMDAIYIYLIKTYHWMPAAVRGMNIEDIRFVLSQEMEGFTVPARAKG